VAPGVTDRLVERDKGCLLGHTGVNAKIEIASPLGARRLVDLGIATAFAELLVTCIPKEERGSLSLVGNRGGT
jgi:hypothetical protein